MAFTAKMERQRFHRPDMTKQRRYDYRVVAHVSLPHLTISAVFSASRLMLPVQKQASLS